MIKRKCSSVKIPSPFILGLDALIAENTRPTTTGGGHFCILCAKVIKGRKSNIRRHFVNFHWSEAPSYTCPGKQPRCQRVFTSRNNFHTHLHRNHPEWKGVPLDTFIIKKEYVDKL